MADDLVPIDESFFGDEELSLVECHYGLDVVWSVVVAQILCSFLVVSFLLLTPLQLRILRHTLASLGLKDNS